MYNEYIIKNKGDKKMTTKFLAKNENDVSLFHKMLHDDDFHRVSNCFWYETWENADGDKVEIERDF